MDSKASADHAAKLLRAAADRLERFDPEDLTNALIDITFATRHLRQCDGVATALMTAQIVTGTKT